MKIKHEWHYTPISDGNSGRKGRVDIWRSDKVEISVCKPNCVECANGIHNEVERSQK